MTQRVDLGEVESAIVQGAFDTAVADTLRELLRLWRAKLARNRLRKTYYDARNTLKNLGIAIPNDGPLRKLDAVCGWPAKAVEEMRDRHILEGFTSTATESPLLNAILDDNAFRLQYWEATAEELIHSCAFATVTEGGENEPQVVISFHSAEMAAAIWDYRRHRIKCGITVEDIQQKRGGRKVPVWVNLYTSDAVYQCKREPDSKVWRCERIKNGAGEPLMVALVNEPSITRPFGRSVISRAVMDITDRAMRTIVRTEVAAEFFCTPQKYILGLSDDAADAIGQNKFAAYIGSILALGPNPETGQNPSVGQFSAGSIQPFTEYYRQLAAEFAAESRVPIHSLISTAGVNPSSAEALTAEENPLISRVNSLALSNGEGLARLAKLALAIAQNKPVDGLSDDERSIKPRFKNPALVQLSSQCDAVVKLASCIDGFGGSRVALELVGLTDEQIARIERERTSAQAVSSVTDLLANIGGDANVEQQ